MTNCIFWGDIGGEIYNRSTLPTITYSDIQGGYAGEGNIGDDLVEDDPLFVNPVSGDFHLQPDSPCVDKGSNTAPAIPAKDFEGDDRIINGMVDMGVDEVANQSPVAVISVGNAAIPLPVTIKVTPQTLNIDRMGNWVDVHICVDIEAEQAIEVMLDGSGSYDPDNDPITFIWTLTGPAGDIPVSTDQTPIVTLMAGSYEVTLVVNDGTVDSEVADASFTLTNQTMADLEASEPSDYTLNDVMADKITGDDCLVISFDGEAIADTVEVGLDVEMTLEGPASGVDCIDVTQSNGKEKHQATGKK
ncbi:choice-of-anchor Q domain-containing protein [Chloroflexota bacterium]